jgi:hypothetical protein
MRPVTAVSTTRPEVGVLVDAPTQQLPLLASTLADRGIHVSFAVDRAPSTTVFSYGDQALPRLPTGGLVRWLGTRDQLHDLISRMGFRHHFLYASNGPSVGQWWLAHGAGGRLIAGAVRLDDPHERLGQLHAGEVIELSVTRHTNLVTLADKLAAELRGADLTAVPVAKLLHDAGVPV